MKRSFALIGFTYLITLVVAIFFGARLSLCFSAFLFLLFIISLFFKNARKNKVIPIALIISSIGFLAYTVLYTYNVAPMSKLDQKEVTISGVICEMPYKDYNKFYYDIQVDHISPEIVDKDVKIRVSTSKAIEADVFDRVTANAFLYKPKDSAGYSSKIYYESKGIFLRGYLDEYSDINIEKLNNKPIYYYVVKVRQKLLSSIRELFSKEEASLISGILIGDKRGISEEIQSDFRAIGISHVLAVSGMHLAIISELLLLIFSGFGQRLRTFLVMLGIVGFMALTGFSPSISRAGIMALLFYGAGLIGREVDGYNSLGLAVFIILLINPFAAGDVSLILSFSATLGIQVLFKPLQSFIRTRVIDPPKSSFVLNFIVNMFIIGVAAVIFTMPAMIFIFGRISLISPIANIIVLFPLTILIFTVALSLLFNLIGLTVMGTCFAAVSTVCVNYMLFSAHLLAKIPFASISTKRPFFLLWIAATLILFSVVLLLRKDFRLIKFTSLLSCIVLLIGILSYQVCNSNATGVAVLESGDGLAVVLTKGKHSAVIACGGEKYYSDGVIRYLQSCDIHTVDFMLISDSTDKNSLFCTNVISEYNPEAIAFYSDDNIKDKLLNNMSLCNNLVEYKEDVDVGLWSNVKIISRNIDGVGYEYVKVNDIRFLISAGEINEEKLPNEWLGCDFIVTSSGLDLVNCKSCKYIILANSKDEATKQIYKTAPINNNIIATAEDGNVIVDCIRDNYISIRRES